MPRRGRLHWLAQRHPHWKALRSIARVTAMRTDKEPGESSTETCFHISSLPPGPVAALALFAWSATTRTESKLPSATRPCSGGASSRNGETQ